MQHSPSEWPLKTFAGGMPESLCPQCVHNAATHITWSSKIVHSLHMYAYLIIIMCVFGYFAF